MPLIISLPCSVFWVTLSLPLMSQPFFMISVSDSFPCFPWKNFHFSRSALPDALILNDSLTFPLSYPAECGGKIESCRDFMKNKYKFTKSGLESQGNTAPSHSFLTTRICVSSALCKGKEGYIFSWLGYLKNYHVWAIRTYSDTCTFTMQMAH